MIYTEDELVKKVKSMDGKPYPAYKTIKGVYQFEGYELWFDHIQGDPFANPSKVRVRMPIAVAEFPEDTYKTDERGVALCDFLSRCFCHAIRKYNNKREGSGKSGIVEMDRPGQEILRRSSLVIIDDCIEARFLVGLPAFGRRIAGKAAAHIFSDVITRIVHDSLYYQRLEKVRLYQHIETVEDAEFIRNSLANRGLIGFVADNAVLPRESGIDSRPLSAKSLIPFESCQSLKVDLMLPNHGKITGMGIPGGVTLIVGGGYHGKSTLLHALENGVYNHIPGDGREFVVTNADAVKIRAEDGRSIQNLNIDPFISNLPFNQETTFFSTANASGSTSQAANILEALEVGANTLLLDEDTLATNFMIRDERMRALIGKDKEPITPFIEHVRGLYEKKGISTVLVMGGSGDYFPVADLVIGMIEYRPHDLTAESRQIVNRYPVSDNHDVSPPSEIHRIPLPNSVDPSKGKKQIHIRPEGRTLLRFGEQQVQVGAVEQLVHPSQLRAIGYAIHFARHYIDGHRSIREICSLVMEEIYKEGLDCLTKPEIRGDVALFRCHEFAATLNRFRVLKVKQRGGVER
ncbi:MAG: ATPase [Candidatus Scalindua sp. AMX11]|nr:MAG: ATPase [Candidatus Scalindua sp.]NOG85300.1 ABC-ATPase domain-containing protein [Planctomycetota bacterium]RZV81483.1 MAG: ATPase [Candidatus Scalindua sp. SCAELEC01]TDE65444.1 MAG: ATPase [Candidatus Scalindua sp. AMX11]GJQ59368.1 MAG: ATPase [Candidatus Scalindua sp.]